MVKDRSREKWLKREERRQAKAILPKEELPVIKLSPSRYHQSLEAIRVASEELEKKTKLLTGPAEIFRHLMGFTESMEAVTQSTRGTIRGTMPEVIWLDSIPVEAFKIPEPEPEPAHLPTGWPILDRILSTKGIHKGLKQGELVMLGGGRRVGKSMLGKTADFMIFDEAAAFTPPPPKTPEMLERERQKKEQDRLKAELDELFHIKLVAEREQLGYGGW